MPTISRPPIFNKEIFNGYFGKFKPKFQETTLPPKTIIVRAVELEGAQRDLYETVRAAT